MAVVGILSLTPRGTREDGRLDKGGANAGAKVSVQQLRLGLGLSEGLNKGSGEFDDGGLNAGAKVGVQQ